MAVAGISVVVPVFNPGQYLRPCLDSLVGQDIDVALVDVIAVDDGSTDGSAAVIEEYAAKHPHFRVIRQGNSGGPGRPRNTGLDASDREYVFFMDADDYLGPEALRRMHEFASEHRSDVVSPKIVGVGRFVHRRVWAQTQVDADLKLAFLTYMPHQLFRTSFVREQGLRFPEGKVFFEDGVFVSRAYLTASRVSLLGDYDYYFSRWRDDSGNRSSEPLNASSYVHSQAIVVDNIRELCPDRQLADHLVLDLYRRKTLKPFTPTRFPDWPEEENRNCLEAAREFAASHISDELEQQLAYPFNLRSHLVRMGDYDALLRHTTDTKNGQVRGRLTNGRRVHVDIDTIEGPRRFDATSDVRVGAELQRIERGLGKLVVHAWVRLDAMEVEGLPLQIVMKERSSDAERVLPLLRQHPARDGWIGLEAAISTDAFPEEPPSEGEMWSPRVRSDLDDARPESRLAVPNDLPRAYLSSGLAIRHNRFKARPYVTKYGNLGIRIHLLAPSSA